MESLESRVLLSGANALVSTLTPDGTSGWDAALAALPVTETGTITPAGLAIAPAARKGVNTPTYTLLDAQPQVGNNGNLSPFSTSAPTGMTSSQMRHAYGDDEVMFGSVQGNGAGQTIAIIDAYDYPTASTDLHAFDLAMGLPDPPSLTRVNETGGSTLPGTDPYDPVGDDWEVEEALDVEWAHTMAPQANIVLVEATSPSNDDLINNAVNYARNAPGVVAITMSWGESEDPSDLALNSYFTTPSGHAGVTFLASTGDGGAPGGYPAFSPNVVAVGGTTLNVDSYGNYLSESGWYGSGGGISTVETQPAYQNGVVTQSTTMRCIPDVSFDADPDTGASIYDTYDFGASDPWIVVGGTSLSSPSWAGLIAVADQGRAIAGAGALNGLTQTLPKLYGLPSSCFHDILTGNNGFAAGVGYDLVTGIGTPVANNLVERLGAGGPFVSTASPLGIQSTTTSSLSFTFSSAMTASSFTVATGIDSFTGPHNANLLSTISGYSWSNGNTTLQVTFTAQSVQGPYSMVIGPDILSSGGVEMDQNQNGVPGEVPADEYTGTFYYDTSPLTVLSSTPANNGVLVTPSPTVTFAFNEAIDPTTAKASNLTLSQGNVSAVSVLAGNTSVQYTLTGLPAWDGNITATLAAGALYDTNENPLSQTYTESLFVHNPVVALPVPLVSTAPSGSLVYTNPTTNDTIEFVGDVDAMTVNLAANQTLTVVITGAGTLQPTLQVTNPTATVLGTATASAAGQPVMLQTLPVATAGNYTITVSGAGNTTGNYTVAATLNAAVQASSVGGATNQTLATAQNINGSFLALGNTTARGAVVGQSTGSTVFTATSAAYAFENIGNTGTAISFTSTTAGSTSIPIGFNFSFFGTSYTSLYVGSNGFLSFGVADTSSTNTNLNSWPAEPVIVPFWDALYIGGASDSKVRYQVLGSGATTHLVIQWNDVSFIDDYPDSGGITFEAVLYPSGSVRFNYQSLADGNNQGIDDLGAHATVGVKGNGTQNVNNLLLCYDNGPTALVNSASSIVLTPPQPTSTDYYSFTAAAADVDTFALSYLTSNPGTGNVTLELLNSSGGVLASGVSGASNVAAAIAGYSFATAGTYDLMVTGTEVMPYSLVVTRNVAFSLQPHNSAATAQSLTGTQGALGYLEPLTSLTLNASNEGWWDATGYHYSYNTNYFVGVGNGIDMHDYFVFSLAGITEPVAAAQLNIFNPTGGYVGPNPSDPYTIYDVSTPIATLEGDGVGESAIYTDLGSGVTYGNTSVSAANDGAFVSVGLNSSALAALNAAAGSQIAFGGSITSGGSSDQGVFAYTQGTEAQQLALTVGGAADWYSMNLTSATGEFSLSTQTPASGPGQFNNTLNLHLSLYDPNGNLVASGTKLADGRNETISYQPQLSGTYTLRVSPLGGTGGEYVLGGNALQMNFPANVHKGDGNDTGTITVNTAPTSNVAIILSSSDPTRLGVPSYVMLPAGQTSVIVPLTVVNDGLLDGPENVTISAVGGGYWSNSAVVDCHDNETATLGVSLAASVSETAAPFTGTITASSAPARDILVAMASSNTSQLAVPATVILKAGQTTATFTATPVDNKIIESGPQTAIVTASVEDWTIGSASVAVTDNDNILTVTLPTTGWEGQTLTSAGTVSLGGTNASSVVVNLLSGNSTDLSVPASVTIPAGQLSATFTVTLLSNSVKAGTRIDSVSASTTTVAGPTSGSGNMTVYDDTLDYMAFTAIGGPQIDATPFPVTLSAYNIANQVIAVYGGAATLSASGQNGNLAISPTAATFVDGVWSSTLTVNAVDPAAKITASASGNITATSNSFAVQAGAAASLQWGTVGGSQGISTPFAATLTAKDVNGFTATSFNGNATLTGRKVSGNSSENMLGNLAFDNSASGSYTDGYTFTPNTDLTVTAVRSYFGSNVSIWTQAGTLLASQAVSGTAGAWTTTTLATSLQLTAGTTYMVSAYTGSQSEYYNTTAPANPSFAIIGPSYWSSGNAFPTTLWSGVYTAVDLQCNVPTFATITVTPASATFVNGVWTGNVTVAQQATGMYLHGDDGFGQVGDSNTFNVNTLIASTTAITVGNGSATYGQPVTFTAKVTPASGSGETGTVQFQIDGGNAGSAITLSGNTASYTTATLTAGNHAIVAIYGGDSNFASSSGSFTETIGKATVAITWPAPAAITYGTALSGTQLDASDSAAGSFVYTPAAGTVLAAGTQLLTVTFTPTDTTDYTTATGNVSLTVNKAATTTLVTAGNGSSVAGQAVTFSATVTPITASGETGTVQFEIDGGNAGSAITLSGNVASYTTSTLSAGSHTIVAVYSGDGNFATSTSLGFTQIVASGIPAWLSSTSAVTWYPGNQTLMVTGNATIIGDPNTYGAIPTIVDSSAAASLLVDTLPADGGDGDPVVHVAAISGNGATTVNGSSTLSVGNFSQTALVNNGTVSLNGAGTIGQLTGNGSLAIGNGTGNYTVRLAPTAIANSFSDTQAALTLGNGATLDITDNTLLLNYGSGSSPLAMVQAAVNGGTIMSSTVNAGQAGMYAIAYADATEAAAVPSGNVKLLFTLTGDARLAGSVNFLDYSVLQNNYNQTGRDWAQGDFSGDGTVNFIDYSLLQNNYNQAVKLTPTVSWATPSAISYGTALSATQLDATASVPGTFAYTPAAGTVPGVGTHVLSVTFTPTDATDYDTASGTVNLTVNKSATSVAVSSGNATAGYGQAVTFTATITPASGTGETGAVQFQIDGGNVGTPVILSGTTAAYTTAALAIGNHSIDAVYSGDGNFLAGNSGVFTQTITKAATTTAVTSSDSSLILGQAVTFTATVTPLSASGETGAVQFQIDGGNVGTPITLSGNTAAYTASSLALGNHTVVAIYSGDGNFAASTSPAFTQVVGKATVTYTLSINDDGTDHYCAGHYAVYASDTLNNGGLASYDVHLGGNLTINNYSPKGNYDDGTGCGTTDELGFTASRTPNNSSPATGTQDTVGYAGGGGVILIYGFGQTAGNLNTAATPGSTGGTGVTQAVYAANLELIKGTFTGAAPTLTSQTSDTGNIFVTNAGYGTEAPVLAFNTVTVVSGSVSQPAAASLAATKVTAAAAGAAQPLLAAGFNQYDGDAATYGWTPEGTMDYVL